jgi:SAM-dependent methyltransferase
LKRLKQAPVEEKRRFNQTQYWLDRHERLEGDPRSVGNLGKSLAENHAAESFVRRWSRCAAGLLRPCRSVLDVGCGYGRTASSFIDAGYEYVGIDVSPVAIAAARIQEPRGQYIVGSAGNHEFARTFDLVCVLYVFVHFTEDADWRELIHRLALIIRPGGKLLFADELPTDVLRPQPHVTERPLALYTAAFAEVGLEIDPSFPPALDAALGAGTSTPPAVLACKTA